MACDEDKADDLIDQAIGDLRSQLPPTPDPRPLTPGENRAWQQHMKKHQAVVEMVAAYRRSRVTADKPSS